MINFNLPSNFISVTNHVCTYLVGKNYDVEDVGGVRKLEQCVNTIVSKLDFIMKNQDSKGKLSGFGNISFNIFTKRLSIPISLNQEHINKLL